MSTHTCAAVMDFLRVSGVQRLDLAGGAPELGANFRALVTYARSLGVEVIDRCNLTVLEEPGQEDLAGFLAEQAVVIFARLYCNIEGNSGKRPGEDVFYKSILALKHLNVLGYGRPGSGLILNLVYDSRGPSLPPARKTLEASYRKWLWESYGVVFNNLCTSANVPTYRFRGALVPKRELESHMEQLRHSHRVENLEAVTCRSSISVDWLGYVYDCDFKQTSGIPLEGPGRSRVHLSSLIGADLTDMPVAVADYCYGCAAGEGSSCSGDLVIGNRQERVKRA